MCPPGTDQTERGPQSWHMIVPTVREKCAITFPGQQTNHNLLDTPRVEHDSWVWTKLARADPQFLTPLASLRSSRHCSIFRNIPSEIRYTILSYLDKPSVFSLALACSDLISEIVSNIERCVLNESAPWADQPLACLGTYLQTVPPRLEKDCLAYRSVELHHLIDSTTGLPAYDSWQTYHARTGGGTCPARQFNWAAISKFAGSSCYPHYPKGSPHGVPVPDVSGVLQKWRLAWGEVKHRIKEDSVPPRTDVMDLLEGIVKEDRFYGPPHEKKDEEKDGQSDNPRTVWILRNHDTKETIRVIRCKERMSDGKSEPRTVCVIDDGVLQCQQRRDIAARLLKIWEAASVNLPPWMRLRRRGPIEPRAIRSITEPITMERVMAIRTWWPTFRLFDLATESIEERQRQSWAGCRFDIVSQRMHACDEAAGTPSRSGSSPGSNASDSDGSDDSTYGWKDVTEEAIERVMKHEMTFLDS